MISKVIVLLLLSSVLASLPYSTKYPGCRNCVLSSNYWKTHSAFAADDRNKIPWPHSCRSGKSTAEQNIFFNTNITWLDFMHLPSTYRDSCVPAGKEFISAVLNRCSGACQDEYMRGHILEARDILSQICPGGESYKAQTYQQSLDIGHLTTVLTQYNNGLMDYSECKREEDIDCNSNGIVDKCEIYGLDLKSACSGTPGSYRVNDALRWCVYWRTSDEMFCKNLAKSNESDCDKNHILDSCQLSGLSDIKCIDPKCIGHASVERTPLECLRCRSPDFDGNGIPDECDIAEAAKELGFPDIMDCNENGKDDLGDIFSRESNDRDANLIPDECQYGSCCTSGVCSIGTLEDCPETFSYSDCTQRYDCFPPEEPPESGSCCVRTSSFGGMMRCVDGLSKEECAERRGYYSHTECRFSDCSRTVGSCCSKQREGNCIDGVRVSFCKELFNTPLFDVPGCASGSCLCNTTSVSVGSCVMNETCHENMEKRDCLSEPTALFDLIPCKYREDMVKARLGSCCKRNGECQDGISDVYCGNIGGVFSSGKCYNDGWCATRRSGSCCYDGKSCHRNVMGECSVHGKEMEEVECRAVDDCLAQQDMRRGCCYIGGKCLTDVLVSECSVFGGSFVENSICELDHLCSGGFSASSILAEMKSDKERGSSVIVEKIQGPETMQSSQIISTTIFSVIVGLVVTVGAVATAVIIYNDKKSGK